jgi:sugar lactone lactonase YvrE
VTEGQAYTIVIGLVFAFVTAGIGIPPTLTDRVAPAQPARADAAQPAPSSTMTPPRGASPPSSAGPVASPPFDAVFGIGGEAPALSSGDDTAPPDFGGDVGGPASPTPTFADDGRLGEVERLADTAGAPHGIAVDRDSGAFYVSVKPSRVRRYSAAGVLEREYGIDGQPSGVALDGDGRLYALDAATARVVRIDTESGAPELFGPVPDVPSCTVDRAARCELSPSDSAPVPAGATFDTDGNLFVADTGQGIIWRFDRHGTASIWDKAPEYLSPTGAGPAALQFDPSGSLVVAVTQTLVGLTGAVFRVPVQQNGAAGPRVEVYRSAPNDDPTGVAVGQSGRVYVALRGADALLVLGPDGSVVARITSDLLADPVGVAFRGQSLLITNQSASTVVRAAVEDRRPEPAPRSAPS